MSNAEIEQQLDNIYDLYKSIKQCLDTDPLLYSPGTSFTNYLCFNRNKILETFSNLGSRERRNGINLLGSRSLIGTGKERKIEMGKG